MTLRGFTGAYYVGLTGLLWVSMGASHTTQAGDHVVCYQVRHLLVKHSMP